MLAILSRTVCCRLIAAFIVMLVVSPYSEPFATMDGTDFGGAGAVDVGGSSKLKTSALDALVPVPMVVVLHAVFITTEQPVPPAVTLDSRGTQRAVLRL